MTFTTRPELRGTFGMVASTHWLASTAGMAVLERGGNAFDAAVATGLTLQVVEPHLNGPGGDLPVVLWSAEQGRPLVALRAGRRARRRHDRALPGARPRARPRHRAARRVRPRRVRRLDAAPARLRDDAPRRRARVRDRLRRGRLSGRPGHHGDDPRGRAAAAGLAGVGGAVPAGAAAGRAVPEPAAGGDVRPDRGRVARRRPRGGDRARAARLLPGLRRGRDRPLLPRARRPARRRRPRLVARDARAAGHVRVPRPHRLQDRAVGPGPGAAPAARAARRLRPRGPVPGRARPHRRRVHEARVRGSGGLLRRPGLRRRPARAAPLAVVRRRAPAADRRGRVGRAAPRRRTSADPRRGGDGGRRRRADARRHRPPRRGRPLRQPRVGDAERRLAAELPGDPGARLAARHARADVLARARPAELAGAGEAPADDALPRARAAPGRAVPRVGHARRRHAGPVVAPRPPPPPRPRREPAGGDRRARVPHRPLPELVPSRGRRSRSRSPSSRASGTR